MLRNANGAASARPSRRQLRPVVSTVFAGVMLMATNAATPSMAQHHGHHGHQGHVAPKSQGTKGKKPVVKRRSDATRPGAHAGHGDGATPGTPGARFPNFVADAAV
jgi:hypothetical protein